MSITFWSPDAPEVLRSEYECMCTWNDSPVRHDCPECQGTGKVHFYGTEGEVNFANANALHLLSTCGLAYDDSHCGVWEYYELPRVMEKLRRSMNAYLAQCEADLEMGGYEYGHPREDSESERLFDRIQALHAFITLAIRKGWRVVHWG